MKILVFAALFFGLVQAGFSQNQETVDPSKLETFQGTFDSKRGVMHVLSCHCYDGGFLETKGGERIAVCFEKSELESVQIHFEKGVCFEMEVTGQMVEHVIKPVKGDVCSPGTYKYLRVTSFTCLD
jgi:hypothetical protein